jgi:hypothetical protein
MGNINRRYGVDDRPRRPGWDQDWLFGGSRGRDKSSEEQWTQAAIMVVIVVIISIKYVDRNQLKCDPQASIR